METIVLPPAVDQPATADPTTAALLAAVNRRITSYFWSSAILLVAGPLYFVVDPRRLLTWRGILLALATAAAVCGTLCTFASYQWSRKGKGLLAVQPWREVPAVVVRERTLFRKAILETADGDQLGVSGLVIPWLQVIKGPAGCGWSARTPTAG